MISIETNNVVKRYSQAVVTIPNITISNRVTLIKGPNGSGKSTLLKAIMGWIRYDGEIHLHGTCSYAPENHSFPKDTTVRTFLRGLHKHSKRIDSHLKTFLLDHKLDSYIDTLSKGMKAKLNLIQCLLYERDIYLLDEPFSGLDVDSVAILLNYIHHSTKTFLITTHITNVLVEGDVISFD